MISCRKNFAILFLPCWRVVSVVTQWSRSTKLLYAGRDGWPRVRSSNPGATKIYTSLYNEPFRSTQPGHPSLGKCNPKAGDALRLGSKSSIVREWMTDKTVWSPYYHGPYLSALAMDSSQRYTSVRLLYILKDYNFGKTTTRQCLFLYGRCNRINRQWTRVLCIIPWLAYVWNKIISKIFHRLIAAHEYFPTCSMSLK